jgi:competence protein ComGC
LGDSIRLVADGPRHDGGFTLSELVVIMLVIGVLLGIAIAVYAPATNAANAAVCRHNQRLLEDSVPLACTACDGEMPGTLNELGPYVANFQSIRLCPADGDPLALDPETGHVACPNHP